METVVNSERCQKHSLVCATVSPLDKCLQCVGPVSSLKWLGYKCRELPQENVCTVEEDGVFSDQHLDNLERSCSPDQEEPEHPQTTEPEEDSSGQEMKHKDVDVDVSLVNVADVKVENGEPGPNCGQLLLHTSPEAHNKDEEGTESLRSDSSKTADPEPMRRHGDHEDAAVPSDSNCKPKLIRTYTRKKVSTKEMPPEDSGVTKSSSTIEDLEQMDTENQFCSPTEMETVVNSEKCQKHSLVCATVSTLDKCVGPVSSLKWLGYKCRELPQENVCKVEEDGVFSDQHLDNLERSCSPDQEEPGHPQTTEPEEDSSGQEMKHNDVEVDVSLVNVADVKVENGEPGPNCGQLLLHTSPEAQNKDEEGTESLRSDSSKTADPQPMRRHGDHEDAAVPSDSSCKSKLTRTHTRKKVFSCRTCGKEFSKSCNLMDHIKIHTGKRPHLCNTCGKTFTQSSLLKRHIATHTGEKPYICKTCGKSYRQRSTLVVHLRIHTGERPFVCNTCGKTFTDSSALKRHIYTHTVEKRYLCNTCNKGFDRRIDLLRHMIYHPEEKSGDS
ncbi:zinc finger protein 37-like [Cololabis saira]|uniref:zinc finger protein 37-like n=1 Tax=Cololabis saira TaxID=129043 RepID=UPI002AD4923A|nr:zinc finger protein 37-like [Cololabis saira]